MLQCLEGLTGVHGGPSRTACVLARKTEASLDTGKEMLGQEGRGWRDVATSQSCQQPPELEEAKEAGPPGGAQPC